MRKPSRILTTLFLAGVLSASAQDYAIGFDQSDYYATVDEPVSIRVSIDPLVPARLFSYGVKLVYAPSLGLVIHPADIIVPPYIDFNGVLGPGALRGTGEGFAGVKGTVDVFTETGQGYGQSLLATFNVTGQKLGDYAFLLELYNTLGPTESIFVDNAGKVWDRNISFGIARFHVVPVVPEPSSVFLMAMGSLALILLGGIKPAQVKML